jgi:hypothetical protein
MTNKHLEPFLKRRGLIIEKHTYSGGAIAGEAIAGEAIAGAAGGAGPRTSSRFTNIGKSTKEGISNIKNNIQTYLTPTQSYGIKDGIKNVAKKSASAVGYVPGVMLQGLKTGFDAIFSTSPEHKFSVKIIKTIRNALRHISQKNADRKDNETRLENLVVTKPIDMEYGGGFLVFNGTFNIKKMVHMGFISGEQEGIKEPKYGISDITSNMDLSQISRQEPYNIDEIVKEILKIINNEEPAADENADIS